MIVKLLIPIFLIACVLIGCSNAPSNSSEPISSSDVSSVVSEISPVDDSISSDIVESSNQEIGSDTTSSISNPAQTNSSSKTNKNNNDLPSSKEETDTKKDISNEITFTDIKITYAGYESSNEPTPYIKGKPIYDVLYGGTRAQIGDKLIFTVKTTPENATDSLLIDTSENISYSISKNSLSILINSSGTYSIGTITIYSKQNPKLSKTVRISIDEKGNPFEDFSGFLSEYISFKGLNYCTVEKGYTSDNPSLSLTKYSEAPAWDDMISRQKDDWKQKCIWLIDEYSKLSFKNVFFMLTPTEIGFSANK